MEKIKNITAEKIKNLLKEINYPGFSRDIVSFGMVKNVSTTENGVEITLQINSDNTETISKLQNEIREKLKANGIEDVNLTFQKPKNQPVQPADQQKPINQQPIPGVKHIIAIASGKGGVGKSTVAVNLAATMSKKHKVGLLDLDIYGPSLPMLVGLNQQPEMTSEKKLIPLEKYNLRLMSFGFINSENAPAVWRGPMVSRMTQQFFEDVEWGELDFLLLDLPPGTGDIQLTLSQRVPVSGALIVTTPQDIALADARKGLEMFKKVNVPILGMIENMSYLQTKSGEIIDVFGKGSVEIAAKKNSINFLGDIPIDKAISSSGDKGIPYLIENNETDAGKKIMKIASDIDKKIK